MSEQRVPPLLLERLAHDELSPAEATAVRARLGEGADAAVAEIIEDDAKQDLAGFAGAVERRLADARAARRRRAALWLTPALAGACALLLWRAAPTPATLPPHLSQGPDAGPDGRIKGLQPHLRAYHQIAGRPEPLADGDRVRPGELVQLSHVGAGGRHGVIVSLDTRGVVTVHWPESGDAAPLLAGSAETLLPSAYELDDAPRFERFLLVTSAGPFAVAPIVAAAQALADSQLPATGPLALPPTMAQASLLLRKESP